MHGKQQPFIWKGRNQKGQIHSGEMISINQWMVKAELRKQGILPTKVKRKTRPLFSSFNRAPAIQSIHISFFIRQLSTMISAGIPIVQSLDILSRGSDNLSLNKIIAFIKSDVESGNSLSAAFQKHNRYFNELFCHLISAGEQSGQLDRMLNRIAIYREKSESLHAKVKKALLYPTTVIAIALLISLGLLIFVVPQFEAIFSSFGAELPFMTRLILNMSRVLSTYWYVAFLIIGLSVFSFFRAKRTSKRFRNMLQRLSVYIVIIGPILRKSVIARFARTLSITFAAGLPLVEALNSVAGATGNIIYKEATEQMSEDVQSGQPIHQSMSRSNVFPTMVIQMVSIGEESGSLELMLSKVADFYEEDVDNAVANLSSLLEPIIMVILGVIIGGLVVALYMPIFKLGGIL